MISPELLRRYPFFGLLTDDQLREVAIIATEETIDRGTVIFWEGEPAETLYFLLEGCIDLYYTVGEQKHRSPEKGIPVGEINPGEPFGISALIEPHMLTSTAFVSASSRVVKIDSAALRAQLKKDRKLDYLFTLQAAKAAISRLTATRIQLAAAWT